MKEFSYGIIPYLVKPKGIFILMYKSSKKSQYWNFIKGKPNDEYESIVKTVKREVFDPLGIARELTGIFDQVGQHPGGILVWDHEEGAPDYNYGFAIPDKNGNPDFAFLEGNWYTTENQYNLLTYYRPIGGQYDRLVGALTFDTYY